ncbi:hypothetical protein pb186bvf_019866 [Paramecium bursaria]
MLVPFLMILLGRIPINASQNLTQQITDQWLTQQIVRVIQQLEIWSYIINDVDFKFYDSNPDKTLYSQSGNLLLSQGQQIYLASKEKVFTCDLGCIACYGPFIIDCIDLVSPSRGTKGYPTVTDIIAKKNNGLHFQARLRQPRKPTLQMSKWKTLNGIVKVLNFQKILVCPFLFLKCRQELVGKQTQILNVFVGYHEYSPVVSDCAPDCLQPCSLCQPNSSILCSQCFDGIMVLNATTFTCTCPVSYSDYRCYACDYTCLTCNGGSNVNCQSCITTSQRFLQSGFCVCPEHYVISSQLNCVQCDWSCNTCYSTSNCQTCMPYDNRYVGASGYCVCQSGLQRIQVHLHVFVFFNIQLECQYTCVYQFDPCDTCPQNSMAYLINSQCVTQDYYYDICTMLIM